MTEKEEKKVRNKTAVILLTGLCAVSTAGCSFLHKAQKEESAAGQTTAQQAYEAEEGVIASGEGEIWDDSDLYTYEKDEEGEYKESISPDGTAVLPGEYEIGDCIDLCAIDGLVVNVKLMPQPDEEDAVIYAKLEKDAKYTADIEEVERGDVVDADIFVYREGETEADENLTRTGTTLRIGGEGIDKEMEEALLGQSTGASVELDITYPEDFEYMDLGGQTVHYRVVINSIAKPEYPSDKEIEKAMKTLRMIADETNEERKMVAVREAFREGSTVKAYPEKVVRQARARYERAFISSYGTIEDFLNTTGTTRAEFKKGEEAYTSARVKDELLLEALKEETGITTSSREYQEYIDEHGVDEDDRDETMFRVIFTSVMGRLDLRETYEGAD